MSGLVRRFLDRHDDARPCILDARTHTYRDVVLGAARVARALSTEGPLAGARVAILVGPGAAFVEAFFGVLLAGGCVVVLSPLHPRPETRYFCEDAGVRAVLVSAAHASPAAPLADSFAVRPLEPILESAGSIEAAEHDRRIADVDFPTEAPALQLYTSGTTGKPKGAVLTHGNLSIQPRLIGQAWGFTERDVLLHALPLHHMHGLVIALLTALAAGSTIRMRTFDAVAIWEEMKEATSFMAVPAMYHRLFLAFDVADGATRERWSAHAKALRLATSGSAALPVNLAEKWRAITGHIPLERFGMTELGVVLTNRLEGERFAGCVGFPLPTVETRVTTEDGTDVALGDAGELWIRGPSMFAGYHDKPEETRKAFSADGWFQTGDTVRQVTELGSDAESAPFKILGRTSVDILKSGGYKLSALEIEEVLREHPAVSEVAVIGIADEAWGERVVACVVLGPGATCDAATLRAFIRERLAAYKVPKDVHFLDALPKNALGKVLKPALMAAIGPLHT